MKTFILTSILTYASVVNAFSYNDYVKVKSGFYKDATGHITMMYRDSYGMECVVHLTQDSQHRNTDDKVIILEKELEYAK